MSFIKEDKRGKYIEGNISIKPVRIYLNPESDINQKDAQSLLEYQLDELVSTNPKLLANSVIQLIK